MIRNALPGLIVSAIIGAAIGGTVSLASQSQAQASPQAIAAAVQRVQDSKADAALASINRKLGEIDRALTTTTGPGGTETVLRELAKLGVICSNTSQGFNPACS